MQIQSDYDTMYLVRYKTCEIRCSKSKWHTKGKYVDLDAESRGIILLLPRLASLPMTMAPSRIYSARCAVISARVAAPRDRFAALVMYRTPSSRNQLPGTLRCCRRARANIEARIEQPAQDNNEPVEKG
jgi:hypothetical protein